ncbi:MAG TPA: radical SAM protein [Terracidiphilus sp.]|nr:radical SAM protein [Terracidiphilus sp.]
MANLAVRRAARSSNRLYREIRMVAMALKSPRHPVFAHMVVTRRCNLACTYCSEFDTFSKPVPIEEMIRRVDRLAALGTTAVTLTGGETLLHPQLEEIIARIRSHKMIVVMITNGYLLSVDRIQKLNRAGLDRMQISIDNVQPDDVSKKSLKVLDQKLKWLAQYAEFQVHIHSVVGAGTAQPEDALTIARRATELGLGSSAGIVHDPTGRIQPLDERSRNVLAEIEKQSKPLFSFARHNPWRANLLEGKPNDWHCPAGGRHIYICENGLVHYCMAQRGYPAKPLAEYSQEDIDRESKTPKACAPYCTIFCVHRVALLDRIRENPREALVQLFPAPEPGQARPPLPVRALTAVFSSSRPAKPASRSTQFFRKAALRILNIQ